MTIKKASTPLVHLYTCVCWERICQIGKLQHACKSFARQHPSATSLAMTHGQGALRRSCQSMATSHAAGCTATSNAAACAGTKMCCRSARAASSLDFASSLHGRNTISPLAGLYIAHRLEEATGITALHLPMHSRQLPRYCVCCSPAIVAVLPCCFDEPLKTRSESSVGKNMAKDTKGPLCLESL